MSQSLFDHVTGGRQGVLDKFMALFHEKSLELSDDEKVMIVEECELPPNTFDCIAAGDTSILVGTKVINELCNVLQVCVDEGFAGFELGDVDWAAKMRDGQFVSTVPMPLEGQAKLYIILECMHELENGLDVPQNPGTIRMSSEADF